MDDATIKSLLAQANAQGGQATPAPTPKVEEEEVPQSTPSSEVVELTPEQQRAKALEVLAKYEQAQVNEKTGEVTLDDDKKIEEVVEEEDISKLPLEEQIKKLQEKLAEENGEKSQEVDPLAKVEAKIEEKGLKLSDFEAEYVEEGGLTEKSLKSLADAGFDKTAVEAYISTRIAQDNAKTDATINSVCENQENFEAMVEWMQTNLDKAELQEYNEGVKTEHAKIYLKDMYSRYSKDASTRTIRGNGRKTTADSSDTFASEMEMVKAMSDSRYETDPVYRRNVRLKASRMG